MNNKTPHFIHVYKLFLNIDDVCKIDLTSSGKLSSIIFVSSSFLHLNLRYIYQAIIPTETIPNIVLNYHAEKIINGLKPRT
jgi:hypothetical protein